MRSQSLAASDMVLQCWNLMLLSLWVGVLRLAHIDAINAYRVYTSTADYPYPLPCFLLFAYCHSVLAPRFLSLPSTPVHVHLAGHDGSTMSDSVPAVGRPRSLSSYDDCCVGHEMVGTPGPVCTRRTRGELDREAA